MTDTQTAQAPAKRGRPRAFGGKSYHLGAIVPLECMEFAQADCAARGISLTQWVTAALKAYIVMRKAVKKRDKKA